MYTEAQKRAQRKYEKEHLVQLNYRITPEQKQRYEQAAKSAGMSLRAFILEALETKILLEQELDEMGQFYKKKLLEYLE